MKINEFVKKVNRNTKVGAIYEDESISIHDDTEGLLFEIPKNATNFLELDWFLSTPAEIISKKTSKYLSALIEEFLKTPIKDRFSEKKYRLRWIDDDDGFANYLDYYGGKWSYGLMEDARQYSQQELDKLKRENPHLAPVIDILNEPVDA